MGLVDCESLFVYITLCVYDVNDCSVQKCRFCDLRGASVGCFVKSCRMSFHFPCGLDNGVLAQYFGTFRYLVAILCTYYIFVIVLYNPTTLVCRMNKPVCICVSECYCSRFLLLQGGT